MFPVLLLTLSLCSHPFSILSFGSPVMKSLGTGAGVLFQLSHTKAVRQDRLSFRRSAGAVVSAVQLEGGVLLWKARGELSRGYLNED